MAVAKDAAPQKPLGMDKDPSTEDLSLQIEKLKADINGLTQTISGLSKAKGEELSRRLQSRADSARASGEETLAMMQMRAEDKLTEAEQYVRANPATAVGLAAGLGFLIGFLGSRR